MNVEIGAEAALFPEKENINGIFVAVWDDFLDSSMPPKFCPKIDVNTLFLSQMVGNGLKNHLTLLSL
jgi:hypothetical protein